MISENLFSSSNDRKSNTSLNKNGPVEFTLSYDQYVVLQNSLPKKYVLLQYKPGKRNPAGPGIKFAEIDNPNVSRLSGNFEYNSQIQGRSKRQKSKKVDRFLENEAPQKPLKRTPSQKMGLNLDEQMMQFYHILTQLKKHKSAYPFLQPVDPKLDGAYNYLEIIKQPMDLSTIQNKLKNGEYQTASQFHGDINKIWSNSYAYNQKTSPFYKLTIEMQKYYKHLCNNQGIIKKDKQNLPKLKLPSKDNKSIKKQSQYEKNSQKDENQKQNDKKSVSEGLSDPIGDFDDFGYDK